jgi:glycylpeptide N-tetradecanoyltransferase
MSVHRFWETQPVAVKTTSYGEKDDKNPYLRIKVPLALEPSEVTGRIISPNQEDFLQEPLQLPAGYAWIQPELEFLGNFLREFYATDPDGNFRVTYSNETISWVITAPGFRKDWCIGVEKTDTKTLIGLIIATPSIVKILDDPVPLVQINFLCVRPSYRGKSLAPIMIREISRRVAITGTMAAIYTAAIELPHAISRCDYYHRPLNMKKLIKLEFCHKNPKLTMAGTLKQYVLPKITSNPGLRKLEDKDVEAACSLLNKYLEQFKIYTIFNSDDFRHHFMPRDGVVYSYVVEKEGQLVNFVSFYSIDTVAMKHEDNIIKCAYLYYVIDPNILPEILTIASEIGFDMFNCIGVMMNETFVKEFRFIKGTGKSHYYLYNWKCPAVKNYQVGVILI